MASRTRNITIDQGADYTETFVVYDSPNSTVGIDMDSDYHANAQLRKSPSHTNSVLTFTTSISHSGGAGSDTVTISANNIQTSNVKAGRYLYEIVLTDKGPSPDLKKRVQEGIATVTSSVEVGSMYTINSTGHDARSSYT